MLKGAQHTHLDFYTAKFFVQISDLDINKLKSRQQAADIS